MHLQGKPKDLQIKRPKENRHPIKGFGIVEEEEARTTVQMISEQNNLPCTTREIQVKKTCKGRQGTTAILALNKEGHQVLNNRPHLYIGWSRCRGFDHFFLPRCTKCAEHGHNAIDCEAPIRDANCVQRGHKRDECRKDPHCHSCDLDGREQRKDHEMMSRDCPVYRDNTERNVRGSPLALSKMTSITEAYYVTQKWN
ncbi:hypothetical protein HPB48_026460 [Haemaphysalis longicornis]|uniref:CCHC-type domain-containing protein n=1 Tax=Haemaphysalis longicornis TaxID=44386 RepID=A0A9J6HAU2_HAELO|nr:hypothetical protein HPB48_026460 [Haemaphysalis longicornis]